MLIVLSTFGPWFHRLFLVVPYFLCLLFVKFFHFFLVSIFSNISMQLDQKQILLHFPSEQAPNHLMILQYPKCHFWFQIKYFENFMKFSLHIGCLAILLGENRRLHQQHFRWHLDQFFVEKFIFTHLAAGFYHPSFFERPPKYEKYFC